MGREDEGLPGDRYRIRLHVAGRHRMVDWERWPHGHGAGSVGVQPNAAQYYIAGSWNEWTLQLMDKSTLSPGTFHIEHIVADANDEEFVIVRAADWNQVFYPAA